MSRPTRRVHNTNTFGYGAITLYCQPFQTVLLMLMLIKTLGCSPFARRY